MGKLSGRRRCATLYLGAFVVVYAQTAQYGGVHLGNAVRAVK